MIASGAVPARRAAPDPIDQLLALDPGGRGIGPLVRAGAAVAAARALRRARRALVVTGFAVGPDMPETDGPPGAAVLGRALRLLGARVTYATDHVNAPVLGAALETLGEPRRIVIYPHDGNAARAVLAAERPTHLIAIERPGRNRAGDYLSMRGESVAAWNAPLDDLFLCSGVRGAGAPRGWPARGARWLRPATIGIGDGGNEIGMGAARPRVARLGPRFARIASVVPVDHLVVAGVSNWGGYGVVAALSRLSGRDLLHTPELERRLVEACVAAGAADGVTRRREATVDGLSLATHAAIVELLRLAARSGIIRP